MAQLEDVADEVAERGDGELKGPAEGSQTRQDELESPPHQWLGHPSDPVDHHYLDSAGSTPDRAQFNRLICHSAANWLDSLN
ncbi:hypothetical protein GCM10009764_12460 [Nocardia ninae]|uniref:Uncharacterized protein n=1 Tax=Nocardia ninae NBRC 108245 TaxID=1210091 RepID=A0A511ME49_9NOCA|nr:hypothetical protein NN4_34440 [Nocardia ninae NBRC 108245]